MENNISKPLLNENSLLADQTAETRIAGLASVTWESTTEQKSRSCYWVHIHPLIKQLIEPNYTDSKPIVVIPFAVHSKHIPVFRSIMTELVLKYNAGPVEFCQAYVEAVLYSVMREYADAECYLTQSEESRKLYRRSQVLMDWEQFSEYILFHEKCIPTKFMLDANAQRYAEEYIRFIGTRRITKEDLTLLKSLSKSQKFSNSLQSRQPTINIELAS